MSNKVKENTVVTCSECGTTYRIDKDSNNIWCEECNTWIKRDIPSDNYWRLRAKVLNAIYRNSPIEKDKIISIIKNDVSPKWITKVTNKPVTQDKVHLKNNIEQVLYQLECEALIKYDYIWAEDSMGVQLPKQGYMGKEWEYHNPKHKYSLSDVISFIVTILVIIGMVVLIMLG